ncbi:MAG: BrnT family toxin [Planctomycetes bacterium]|nr:BrnT family toxin [Planctomycetota bacterium]
MPWYFFIWTPEIIEHLAEHEVTPEEFEEVVGNPDGEDRSRSSGNLVAFGTTSAGRLLCCVFNRFEDGTIEPITAYDVGEQ